jgi:threonylcarbamoyladenosine tRNA methylthiotransferase MtaB
VTYAVVTLGCKLNQYDSARAAGRLGGASQARAPEEADLILLNTCTVTHRADREARRLVRALKRTNPRALVAVTGCGAKLHEAVFRAMPEVDEVLPDAAALEAYLAARLHGVACPSGLPHFGERTRALLKVQEGCGFSCSYCIVPVVRGPSRSVPPGAVVREFRALLDAGHKEIVLTGINTGEYGKDVPGWRGGLAALLEVLLQAPGRYRIRLNSVEPKAVTPGLVALLRREPALAKHLQVPLQSGSDRVLRAMRRNYRAATYASLVETLAQEVPGIGIGADVLAGFPTETAEDFEQTVTLIDRSPLAFLHAFSYSPRPQTPASRLLPLDPREVHERTRLLRALGERKKAVFASAFVGQALEALTLAPEGNSGRALTTNFLDVLLSERVPSNLFVRVLITGMEGGRICARVVPE